MTEVQCLLDEARRNLSDVDYQRLASIINQAVPPVKRVAKQQTYAARMPKLGETIKRYERQIAQARLLCERERESLNGMIAQISELEDRKQALIEEAAEMERAVLDVTEVIFDGANQSVSGVRREEHAHAEQLRVQITDLSREIEETQATVMPEFRRQASDPEMTAKKGSRRGSRRLSIRDAIVRRAESAENVRCTCSFYRRRCPFCHEEHQAKGRSVDCQVHGSILPAEVVCSWCHR